MAKDKEPNEGNAPKFIRHEHEVFTFHTVLLKPGKDFYKEYESDFFCNGHFDGFIKKLIDDGKT